MSAAVVTVKPEDTLWTALLALLKHGISGLPVVDDRDRLIGVITEADLVKLICDPTIKDEKIDDYMTKDIQTVKEERELSDVAKIMDEQQLRRIPVVRNGQVVGIIARRDLLRYVAENEEVVRSFAAVAIDPAGE